jgi:5-methylcytosine-specific restriction protein B
MGTQSYWFVGASFGGTNDQTLRFLKDGIWENGNPDKYIELVKAMQPGERIAIKAAYTRKYHLPFNYDGKKASVMGIKATGTITKNLGDGRTVLVNWDQAEPEEVREWYFYTNRRTVWCVEPGDWMTDALIAFTFDRKAQDYERFRIAWGKLPTVDDSAETSEIEDQTDDEEKSQADQLEHYSLAHILADGCFLDRSILEGLLSRLRNKKNLILQGPPGTGKTWLAKRLAFALMQRRDESKVRAVQFHPNLSYEDFVRGWRPSGEGKLSLIDGIFMEMIRSALKEPTAQFVIVIEEINRGNPAQIFGEMLTLLEADKRKPAEALELSYRRFDGERVYIPDNLFVIGTMNIADRSLALVDIAFRRRFAFVDLKPQLNEAWKKWVVDKNRGDTNFVNEIEQRIKNLNETIATDPRLGTQFQIGHSYVTPIVPLQEGELRGWFKQVAETEIGPLLREYWFDDIKKAEEMTQRLIAGL